MGIKTVQKTEVEGNDIDSIRADWNALTYQRVGKPQFDKANFLLNHHSFREDSIVWDLGMGDGKVTSQLIAPRVPFGLVIGVDNNSSMLETAKATMKGHSGASVSILLGDVTQMKSLALELRLAGDQGMPDVVVSNSVFNYCLTDLQAHDDMLQALQSHMKPGGVLLFSFTGEGNFSKLEDGRRIAREDPRFKKYFAGYTDPGRHDPSPAEYEKLLCTNGFIPLDLYLCDADRKDADTRVPRQLFPSLLDAAEWFKTSVQSHMKFLQKGGAHEEEKLEFAKLVVSAFLEQHPQFLKDDGSVELDNTSLIVHAKKT